MNSLSTEEKYSSHPGSSFQWLLLLIALLLLPTPLLGQKDSVPPKSPSWVDASVWSAATYTALPIVAFDLLHYRTDEAHRSVALHYAHGDIPRWESFAIPLPLVATWGMHWAGVEARSSSSLRMASAHALSAGIAVAMVQGTKRVTKRMRPDGQDAYSFPSGHTAYAFGSAAILDAEYGEQYPWLAASGYALASGVGVARILHDRHWATDVITGAGVGIGAVYIGYLLNDLLWDRHRYSLRDFAPSWGVSPLWLSLDFGYTTIPSSLSDFTPEGWGIMDAFSIRLPLYRRWGVAGRAALGHRSGGDPTDMADHYSLLGSVSYLYPIYSSRFALEGRLGLGYLSESRISTGEITPRKEATPFAASAILGEASCHLQILLRHHTMVSLNAGYQVAPTARPYDRSEKRGMKGGYLGMSVGYLIQ